jgi:GNAT superfamily N-acetyltransferase
MDESIVLPICLHDGPVSLSRLPELAKGTSFEKEFHLDAGVHATRLRELSHACGATGVAAVEGDQIVGLLRFFPSRLQDVVGYLCPQEEQRARRIAALDVSALPSFEDLQPKTLWMGCFQVVPSHRSRGVGGAMVQKTIDWCRQHGWEEIEASGVEHIFPIMAWCGMMSARSLHKHGFEVEGCETDQGIKEAVVSQRLGHHGEEIRQIWEEEHAGISEDEAAVRYTLRLRL